MAQLTNVEDVYPLTGTQLGMLYHTLEQPDANVYTSQLTTELFGDLDRAGFQEAWDQVTARHEALRTAFVWDALDEPVQVVRERVETGWTEVDVSHLDGEEQRSAIAALLADDRRQRFDLAMAPLSRMTLIRTGRESWLWVWTSHHLSLDGWSTQIVLDELFLLYGERNRTEQTVLPAPFSFREFVDFEAHAAGVESEQFWQTRLEGFVEPHHLEVPGLSPDPGSSGHETLSIPLEDIGTLQATAAKLGVTLNTLMAGAWSVVLSRWVRSPDVVFGSTLAGRPLHLHGVDRAVGLFITTLPMRIQVDPRSPLGDWLRGLQSDFLAAQDHQYLPLSAIQGLSDVAPGHPLFESVLVVGNYPGGEARSGGERLTIGRTRYIEASNYPLAILVELGDDPELIVVYDSARLSGEAAESIGRQMVQVLTGFATDSSGEVAAYTAASEIDETVHSGEVLEPIEVPIHELIGAAASPDRPAVLCDDQVITYGELEEMANRLARQLIDAGTAPGTLVGLYLPRSVELIVGIVGILQAGCAYVPLDPEYPASHIRGLLERDEIQYVITRPDLMANVPDSVAALDIGDPHVPGASELPRVDPEQLAYVIHTSGSTGQPKGVMVTHRNLVASTLARHEYYRDPVGSFLLLSSFAFDSSVAGIFWTLTTGGALVLPAAGLEHDAEALASLIEDHAITHTLCLPSVYALLLETVKGDQLESLEAVIVAGEACPPGLISSHFTRLETTALYNEYGPTEGTVWCTVHQASRADEVFPIGRPIPGSRVFVLDERDNPVPTGFTGEICVAGSGVVPGYLGRPDLTEERFVTTRLLNAEERLYRTGDLGAWRRDGVLLYLGRSDSQLKVRGRRIEASAIESALRSQPAIREAVAVGRSTTPDRPATQLVAYVETDPAAFDVGEAKHHLADTLPEFMVPDVMVPLTEIPRLPNGKVDVAALPDPHDRGHDQTRIAPRNERERLLVEIWSDLLGLDEVGVRDDFFELGGDSIVSIRMISRARQAGLHVSPGQFASRPTIEQLALAADAASIQGEDVSGPVPLGPVQRWFFGTDHPVPDHWNQSSLFSIEATVDPATLERALQACVTHHEMLRTRFDHRDGAWQQGVDPGATIALEVADGADLDEIISSRQRALSLERGPVIRAVLIPRPSDERDLLFLAVHHLVVDVVSWAILVDDLERAYVQASAGEDIQLAPRATSYRDWVAFLASDEALRDEIDFWAADLVEPAHGAATTWGTEASQESVTVELDADTTGLLLGNANDAYRTRPEELMVAALATVLEPRPDGTVCLALEGHGRPASVSGVDLSRAIGWFTAQYPVALSGEPDDEGLITATKEKLRAIPNGGVGYGVLRYVHQVPELARRPEPEYLFNYVGRELVDRGGLFRRVSWCDESARAPSNRRTHRIEIVASIGEGRLALQWRFSRLHDSREVVTAMASGHVERLRELVSHCMADETGGFTPSDFPAAGLGQEELDELLDGLL